MKNKNIIKMYDNGTDISTICKLFGMTTHQVLDVVYGAKVGSLCHSK